MDYKAQKVGNVPNLGDIYQVAAPLDQQILAFAEVGIHTLAAPDEVAQVRLEGISNDYSRTSIALVRVKGAKTILVRNSFLMHPLLASAAVRAHRNGRYFEMCKDVYDEAEARAKSQNSLAPKNRSALILSQDGDFSLTPKMPEAQFILRKQTLPYFLKFTKGKITFRNVSTDYKDNTLVNYLWFDGPRGESDLSAGNGYLDDDDRAFGVLPVSREAGAQKFSTAPKSELYTAKNIQDALSIAGISGGVEKLIFNSLPRKS